MDIAPPDPVQAALIGAFIDHERAVEGLAAETDRGMSTYTLKAQVVVLRVLRLARAHGPRHPRPDRAHALTPLAPTEIAIYPPEEIRTILTYTASLTHLRGRIRHMIVATLRPILSEFPSEVRLQLPDSPLLLSNPSSRVTTR